MEQLRVQFFQPFTSKKLGKMLEIEGVLLQEGRYKDRSGRTVFYPAEVIERSLKSFCGVPFLVPHSEDNEDVKKVGGFIKETWMEDPKTAMYRAYVYKPSHIEMLNAGLVHATSIEATVSTARNPEMDCEVATALIGEAIAGTNRPACAPCMIRHHRMVKAIQLENKNGGVRVSSEETNPTQTPLEPPTEPTTDEETMPISPQVPKRQELTREEFEEKMNELIKQAYPLPKTKAWGDMSESEKFQACSLHFKNKGYPLPKAKAQGPTKVKDEISDELQWKWPSWFPAETKQWMLDAEQTITTLNTKVKQLEKDLEDKNKEDVQREVAAVKALNPGFDPKQFLEGVTCPARQKAMLSRYLTELETLIPKFKLDGVSLPAEGEGKVDKICMETFGMPLESLAKSVEGTVPSKES